MLIDLDDADAELRQLSAKLHELDALQRSIGALIQAADHSGATRTRGLKTRQWLTAYGDFAGDTAGLLIRLARLRERFPLFAAAVDDGRISHEQSLLLARHVTEDRQAWFAAQLEHFLAAIDAKGTVGLVKALEKWIGLVAQEIEPPADPKPNRTHILHQLFGGGSVHSDLDAAALAIAESVLDALAGQPDPVDDPVRRTLAERRGDAFEELCHRYLDGTLNDHEPGADDDEDDQVDEPVDDECCPGHDEEPNGPEGDVAPTPARRHRRAAKHATRRKGRPSKAKVTIVMDVQSLAGRNPDDPDWLTGVDIRINGRQVRADVAARFLCDSSIRAAALQGREVAMTTLSKTFTPAQHEAMALLYDTCGFPGCDCPVRWCDIHHVIFETRGGATSMANGVPLCRRHHRLMHLGWTIEHHADGTWWATDPRGRTHTGRRPQAAAA